MCQSCSIAVKGNQFYKVTGQQRGGAQRVEGGFRSYDAAANWADVQKQLGRLVGSIVISSYTESR